MLDKEIRFSVTLRHGDSYKDFEKQIVYMKSVISKHGVYDDIIYTGSSKINESNNDIVLHIEFKTKGFIGRWK